MSKRFFKAVSMSAVIACIAGLSHAQEQHHRYVGEQVQLESFDRVQVGDHVRVEDFQALGAEYDLELDRIEVLTENALLQVGSSDGLRELPRPQVVLLSGIVAGDADSRVFISLSAYGTNGFIEQQGEIISISSGPYELEKELKQALRTAKMTELLDPAAATLSCGYSQGNAALEPLGLPEQSEVATYRGGTTCRIAGIAVESDYEFTSRLFGGNTNAAAASISSRR